MTVSLLLIVAFLVIAAGFEGAETSLLSLSEVRLQTLIKKGDPRALTVAKLRHSVRKLLGTLLMGQTVCDIAAASLATLVAHDLLGESGVAIETFVMTVIVLIFVNLIPKSHAANHHERWALAVAGPVHFLTKLLGPLVTLIDWFVGLFVRSKGASVLVTEEEIMTMTRMGVKAGVVEYGEKELIGRVFLFNDITAGDVLTPKEFMVTLDAKTTLREALPMVNSTKYSRFPVHEGDRNRIVGIVHIKDVLAKLSETGSDLDRVTLKDLAAAPTFVPETELIDDLFRNFKAKHIHMAIVLDAAKEIAGLITLEDLIEELVGEISDESDIDEHVMKRVDKNTVLVHGDTDVADVNRFFNTKLETGAHRTIGRLIAAKLGKTPKQGQQVTLAENLSAVVEQVSRRRVLRVRLAKIQTDAPKLQQV